MSEKEQRLLLSLRRQCERLLRARREIGKVGINPHSKSGDDLIHWMRVECDVIGEISKRCEQLQKHIPWDDEQIGPGPDTWGEEDSLDE